MNTRLAPWPLAGLLLALALAACAAPPPSLPEPPPPMVQSLGLRLLDQNDRPVPGARVSITPLLGRPQEPGPYVSDARGLVELPWLTHNQNQREGAQSQDQVYALQSRLDYQVEAEGYLPARGRLEAEGHHRQLARPELRGIDTPAKLGRRMQTVVLHKLGDLLGPGLKERPGDDPLARRCLEFHEKNRMVAQSLNTEFAWPSFIAQGDLLRVRLDWRGAAWSMLGRIPLAGQVSLSSGLPLAMLVGEDLLPAPGVGRVSVEVLSEISPLEGDPLAAPVRARVEMVAPAAALRALAGGQIPGDAFLRQYPPKLVHEGPLATTPFGGPR